MFSRDIAPAIGRLGDDVVKLGRIVAKNVHFAVDILSFLDIMNSSETYVKISVPAARVSQWHLADIFTDIKLKRWQAVGRNLWGFAVHTILRFYRFPCCLPEKEDWMSYTNRPLEDLDVLDNFQELS